MSAGNRGEATLGRHAAILSVISSAMLFTVTPLDQLTSPIYNSQLRQCHHIRIGFSA